MLLPRQKQPVVFWFVGMMTMTTIAWHYLFFWNEAIVAVALITPPVIRSSSVPKSSENKHISSSSSSLLSSISTATKVQRHDDSVINGTTRIHNALRDSQQHLHKPENMAEPSSSSLYVSDEHVQQIHNEDKEEEKLHGMPKPSRRLVSPSIGTNIKILVLLIQFKDHANRTDLLPPRSYFEELFNGNGSSVINPVGSVRQYLRYNSMNKYRVRFDVRGWNVANETEAYYANGTSGQGQFLQPLFTDALNKYDNDGTVNWYEGYVRDNGIFQPKLLNGVVVLHSGIAAEYGDLPSSCFTTMAATMAKDRLRSMSGNDHSKRQDSWISNDGHELAEYAITSAWDVPNCNNNNNNATTNTTNPLLVPAQMGRIVYEYLHNLGLEDLYEIDSSPPNPIGGVGRVSIMSSSNGWDNTSSATPGHLSSYERQQLDWVVPIVIDQDGYYAIPALEVSSTVYKIIHGYPDGEYLLIENKQPLKWDSDMPSGTGGIVIYHIDERADGQKNPGYPGMDGFPGKHYKVAVIAADGRYDLEKHVNNGDAEDFWRDNMTLGSYGNFPNTDAYQGGNRQATGVSIEVLSKPGFIMIFRVSGIGSRSFEQSPESVEEANEESTSVPDKTTDGNNSLEDSQLHKERNTTGQTMEWMFAMIMGLGLMLGLVVFIL